jgi:hypothetical protein
MKVGKLFLKSSVLTRAALSQSVDLDISMAPTMPCQYNIAWHSGTWTPYQTLPGRKFSAFDPRNCRLLSRSSFIMPVTCPKADPYSSGFCKDRPTHASVTAFRLGMGWSKHWSRKSIYSLLLSIVFFVWWLLSSRSRAWPWEGNDIVSGGQADLEQ